MTTWRDWDGTEHPVKPEGYPVPDAVLEAIRSGATTTERARIKRELIEILRAEHPAQPFVDTRDAEHIWEDNGREDVLRVIEEALDRICPEEAS